MLNLIKQTNNKVRQSIIRIECYVPGVPLLPSHTQTKHTLLAVIP